MLMSFNYIYTCNNIEDAMHSFYNAIVHIFWDFNMHYAETWVFKKAHRDHELVLGLGCLQAISTGMETWYCYSYF